MISYPTRRHTWSAVNKKEHSVTINQTAPKWFESHPVVVTVVEPSLRNMIDLALQSPVQSMHAETLAVATQMVTEQFTGALFISPTFLQKESLQDLQRLISITPGYAVAAVVRESSCANSSMLLRLGSFGVRSVVDLSAKDGWGALRDTVAGNADGISTTIGIAISDALESSTEEARRFFIQMARLAPRVSTSRAFSKLVGVSSSTLSSRFFRAQLPSPTRFIAMVRLVHLARLLEDPKVSFAFASRRLRYSSPQALSRHLRTTFDMAPGDFRRRFTGASLLADTVDQLFSRHLKQFEQFDPHVG